MEIFQLSEDDNFLYFNIELKMSLRLRVWCTFGVRLRSGLGTVAYQARQTMKM